MAAQPAGSVVSTSDLLQMEERIQALLAAQQERHDAQIAECQDTILRQAKQIENLEVAAMIQRARQEGQRDAFYLFSRLPKEVQFLIWNWAQPCGRLLEIEFKPRKVKCAVIKPSQPPSYVYLFDSKLPLICDGTRQDHGTLFRTCRDSRLVSQKAYELCLTYSASESWSFFHHAAALASDSPIFLNLSGVSFRPKLDIICLGLKDSQEFPNVYRSSYLNEFKFGNISRLALTLKFVQSYGHMWFSRVHDESRLNARKLQQFIIVGPKETDQRFLICLSMFKDQEVVVYQTHESLRDALVKYFQKISNGHSTTEVEFMTEAELRALC